MSSNGNTASYRILEFLTRNRSTEFSNTGIASALSLPQDSVRRVINTLRVRGAVKAGREPRYWQIA